jgi:hypothetical protein
LFRSISLYQKWFPDHHKNNRKDWTLILQIAQPCLNEFTVQQLQDRMRSLQKNNEKSTYESKIAMEDLNSIISSNLKIFSIRPPKQIDIDLNSPDLAYLVKQSFKWVPAKYPNDTFKEKITYYNYVSD